MTAQACHYIVGDFLGLSRSLAYGKRFGTSRTAAVDRYNVTDQTLRQSHEGPQLRDGVALLAALTIIFSKGRREPPPLESDPPAAFLFLSFPPVTASAARPHKPVEIPIILCFGSKDRDQRLDTGEASDRKVVGLETVHQLPFRRPMPCCYMHSKTQSRSLSRL